MPTQILSCQHCGGDMTRQVHAERNLTLQLYGVVLFIIGVALVFTLPGLGWLIGGALCLISLSLGYRRHKVWLCGRCGYYFNRR